MKTLHDNSVRSHRTALQRGAVGLTLALIGMLSVSAFVVPMLVRASNSSQLQQHGPLKTEAGRSAVEHVFWSLREDPAFLAGFTGNPPSNSYQINAGGVSAQVSVTSEAYNPPSQTLDFVLTAVPSVIPEDTTTPVTFTLEVFNNSETVQQIEIVEISPQGGLLASFLSGSSLGFELSDPLAILGGWEWDVWPLQSIDPLGASETHQWTLELEGSEGNYWLDVVVQTVDGETFHVPIETVVKATSLTGLDIETTITPEVVEADTSNQFDIQILLENNSGLTEAVTRIRHILPAGLSYVADSTGGVTMAAPTVTTGYGPDGTRTLLEWTFGSGFNLENDQPQQLTFSVGGSLPIGEYATESTFRVASDGASADDYTVSTGQSPIISSSRKFDVTVVQDGFTVDVETWLVSNEPVISSVRE